MVRLADIVRQCGEGYQERYREQILPSPKQALRAIKQCRTSAMGGAVYYCRSCDVRHYQYHSCRNRHCPQCQHQIGEIWLQKRLGGLLPTHYFMLTFTLPESLRFIARSNQKLLYSLMFRCAADATQQLAKDERHIGGKIGLIGVLLYRIQHVLPKEFVKVRYYGLFSPSCKEKLAHCLQILLQEWPKVRTHSVQISVPYQPICPSCGIQLSLVFRLQVKARCPP